MKLPKKTLTKKPVKPPVKQSKKPSSHQPKTEMRHQPKKEYADGTAVGLSHNGNQNPDDKFSVCVTRLQLDWVSKGLTELGKRTSSKQLPLVPFAKFVEYINSVKGQ